jgi:hypothetical protein
VTSAHGKEPTKVDETTRPATLVWIDAREAVIVRWQDDRARLERVESEVPAHHKATGHVRHDPGVRHGGGGPVQTAGEPHRLEHLERFVVEIASRLAPDDDLLILGPGTVCERLERHVLESDAHHGRHRRTTCEAASPLTDRQLIARLRQFAGVETRRRTAGAYRWSEPPAHRPSGQVQLSPRRVIEKLPRQLPDRGRP